MSSSTSSTAIPQKSLTKTNEDGTLKEVISDHSLSVDAKLELLWKFDKPNDPVDFTFAEKSYSIPEIAAQFFQKVQRSPSVSQAELFAPYPKETQFTQHLATILNFLLKCKLINISLRMGGEQTDPLFTRNYPIYEASKYLVLNSQQQQCYNLIADAGPQGIWKRSLTQRSSLDIKRLTKTVSHLINYGLVSQIKGPHAKRKIVYIITRFSHSLASSTDIWIAQSGTFNQQIVDRLILYTQRLMQSHESLTGLKLYELLKSYVADVLQLPGFSKYQAYKILNSMVYRGILQYLPKQHKNSLCELVFIPNPRWAKLAPNVHRSPLSLAPCGRCPLVASCSVQPKSIVTPQSCEYFMQWLSFNNELFQP